MGRLGHCFKFSLKLDKWWPLNLIFILTEQSCVDLRQRLTVKSMRHSN